MVRSAATSVTAYLASLPPDRRKVVAAVRKEIRAALPTGYVERMNWGMISYEVPLATFPDTYNGQPLSYAALAAQKHNYAVYLMGAYQRPALTARLQAAFKAAGKKLDMGKSCLRFKSLEDLPPGIVGEVIAAIPLQDFLQDHARSQRGRSR